MSPTSTPSVLLLATLDTKAEEHAYLKTHLRSHGVRVITIDVSLDTGGALLGGEEKCLAMVAASEKALQAVDEGLEAGANAILGIGGGTGGEIILQVLQSQPITFPKVLVTTLPFDPRIAIADNSIVLVPTLADIAGLNATLREVFENTAAMVAGLCQTRRKGGTCVDAQSVGITALGVTDGAVRPLLTALRDQGQETTVFHANGYGGAAFARFAKRGAFHSVIDLTPHEVTRIHVAGAHVPMTDRFNAALDVPRIVLPGGVNFVGLGQKNLMPEHFLARPHYEHSNLFTHAKLTFDEMEHVTKILMAALAQATSSKALIVPLGGFSSQDCVGGAIEDANLRGVFFETAKAHADPNLQITAIDAHLFAPEITETILRTHGQMMADNPEVAHVG
ncbi:MAG: Tm-1-like ATP-binding domain-containing protein [Pseudomonadota bacterium]